MPAKRRREVKLICSVNVAAFLSIQVVLLFIVMSPYFVVDGSSRIAVDLAKVNRPTLMRGARREDALLVSVMRDGKVFLRNDQIQINQLGRILQLAVERGAEKKVYVNADARSKYGQVAEVLEQVQASGLTHVAFLVDERKAAVSVR